MSAEKFTGLRYDGRRSRLRGRRSAVPGNRCERSLEITPSLLTEVIDLVPDEWIAPGIGSGISAIDARLADPVSMACRGGAREPRPFDYVILRRPRASSEASFVNVGAVLYCRALDFLGAAGTWNLRA